MAETLEYFVPWATLGYLSGSCPTGYLLVRLLKGEDIREFGSGNIGATNVARVLGKKWALFTAIADMFKGGLAILLTMAMGYDDAALLSAVGAMSVIGHNFPVWIGFKGGKGVATSFGVIAFFDFFNPSAAILGGVVWFAAREISCMVSLASMAGLFAAAFCMPVFGMPRPYFFCGILLALFSVARHGGNIARVAAGHENKVKPFFPRRGGRE
ncbi:MAG: glycerol-3-phosphate 1-O-acyltransferase PlsY [Synergistaceae bacterium]|jgi:glycerol-3-phosphate acyltransferase PlsY|nr:glycerol-3-phosphate 1-O-acyltransferase PlsY [Synergistaceae bacterium]